MDDVLTRAEAYLAAGAADIMIHSRKDTPDKIFEFCKRCNALENRRPLVAVPSTYNHMTEKALAEHGVNMVI